MNAKERRELLRLQRLWATCRATMKQMLRCGDLEAKARAERLLGEKSNQARAALAKARDD